MERTFKLQCQSCNKYFIAGGSRVKYCGHCKKEIEYKRTHTCSKCGKEVESRDQNGRGYECGCHTNFYKQNSGKGICKRCKENKNFRTAFGICLECTQKITSKAVKENKQSGKCTICGLNNEIRDQNGRGYECGCHKKFISYHFKENLKSGPCSICGAVNTNRDRLCRGIECGCHDKWYNNWFESRDLSNVGFNIQFCEKCNETTPHNGNTCIKCNPNSNPNIIKNFIFKDNDLFYYDKNIKNYVLWDNYKKSFNIKNTDFQLPKGFKFYPTFRSQESKTWEGASCAFEQNLIDNGIEWFVYIKFYIDKNNNNKPLVVGKSGSLLVNKNGSDVNFSEDINDGPARRYLHDNDIIWDKTQIAIFKAFDEHEALKIEKFIALKYNLFYS